MGQRVTREPARKPVPLTAQEVKLIALWRQLSPDRHVPFLRFLTQTIAADEAERQRQRTSD